MRDMREAMTAVGFERSKDPKHVVVDARLDDVVAWEKYIEEVAYRRDRAGKLARFMPRAAANTARDGRAR